MQHVQHGKRYGGLGMTNDTGPAMSKPLATTRQHQANLLADELARQGWNQADLARATGLPRYTISRIVRGKVLLSDDIAQQIALALNLDPDAFSGLSRRSGFSDVTQGFQANAQPGGKVRIRVNALVQPGVHLAVEALLSYDEPLRLERLSHVLSALYEPLPR